MPRLFTGLEIPPDTAFALSLKRGGLQGARWIDPENYHITLRYIGDVDHRTAEEIFVSLERVGTFEPFEIALSHLDVFGGTKPRALYAGVEPCPELSRLQQNQERLLQRIGLPPDGRKFIPHVTLARLRDASAHDVARHIAQSGQFIPLRFTVNRFVLFSSRNSIGGGPYLVEQSFPLAA